MQPWTTAQDRHFSISIITFGIFLLVINSLMILLASSIVRASMCAASVRILGAW